jgi:tRNA (guanine-N7-)-methyltransferase
MSKLVDKLAQPGDLRSFGRRRGRSLSERQAGLWRELLPSVSLTGEAAQVANPARLFSVAVREVWLEIGFGGGEHLLWQAEQHPDAGILGCEPYQDGIVKVLSAISARGGGNIRLFADDARILLRQLPAAAIARAFLLFPDPWPKRRHWKRRLVSEATLAELARVLRPGAELRIATDIAAYAEWILVAVRRQGSFRWLAQTPADWRRRGSDWPPTRYEAKAIAAGRRCSYFRFLNQRGPAAAIGAATKLTLPACKFGNSRLTSECS